MGRPKRNLLTAASETLLPPPQLTSTQSIARVLKAEGSNLYRCQLPSTFLLYPGKELLFELPTKFRNTIWIKRGGYVLVETSDGTDGGDVGDKGQGEGKGEEGNKGGKESKVGGEIINVVRDEKEWRKASYWPGEFEKKDWYKDADSEEEEESRVGKMPPSDSESDY